MRSPRTATKSSPCLPQPEKARVQQRRSNAAINKFIYLFVKKKNPGEGNSLAVQWLRLSAFIAEGPGSIPGQGTRIPKAEGYGKKTPQKIQNT